MNKQLNILFLILLTACNINSTDKKFNNFSDDSSIIKTKTQPQNGLNIKRDTIKINDQKYLRTQKDEKFNCLLSIQGDTIIKTNDSYFKAEFLDIDLDGFKDISVNFYSSNPNYRESYLYNKKTNTFKFIENCDFYIKKISATEFYMSYNKLGCSDMNWESYLSKIENNKLVNIGYMHGQGCDSEIRDNTQVIDIYKIFNSRKEEMKLVKNIPYKQYIKKHDDKWGFFENYWTSNYKKFEQ